MAVVIAEGEVVVTADASAVPGKIAKEVEKGDAALNKAGKKSGGSLFGGILKTGALAVAGVGVLLAGKAMVGGISRALGIEDAQAKLTGLGHSTEAVDGIMQNALASVRGTAFGLNDAATVAASAVAAGIAPGQELERTLKLVADASTIAGTDMGSMGAVFNKVAASNKLQGDSIAQLHDMGIPALSLVAKQLGVTSEEASKMVSKGEVDFATFSAAMEAGMGGAALKSGETFRGALANSGAALNRLGEMFAAPALQALTPLLVSVTGVVDRLATALKPLAEMFAAQLIPLVDTLSASFDGLNFDGVIKGADSMVGIGSMVGGIVSTMITSLASLLPELISMGTSLIVSLVNGIVVALPQIMSAASGLVTGLIGALVEAIPLLLGAGIQLVTGLISGVIQVLPSLITTVVAAIPTLATALIEMLPMLLDAGILLFTSLIDSVVTILPMLLTTIIGMLPDLITSILSMIPQILDSALVLFTALVEAIPIILPMLLDAIIKLAPKLVDSVISMLPKLLNSAITLFTGIVEAIPKIVPKLLPALLDLAPKMVSTIIGMVPKLLQAGVDLIGGLVDGLWKAAGSVGKALLSIIKDAVGGFLDFLGIKSPSRLMMGFGKNTVEGLVGGLDEKPVVAQMNKVASAMSRTLSTSLEAGMTVSPVGTIAPGVSERAAYAGAGSTASASSSAASASIVIYGDVVLDAKNVREFSDVVDMIRALPQVARAGRGEMKGA